MKIKEGYVIRQVADSAVVLSLKDMNCDDLMTVGGSGTDAWKLLEQDITFEELIEKMLELYDVDEDELRRDMTAFLDKLRAADVLDE